MPYSALALWLCAAAQPAVTAPAPAHLDFRTGTLAGWEGEGFYVTSARRDGPSLQFGVCSSDNGTKGRKGVLHRLVKVPPGAGVLRCKAFAGLAKDQEADNNLDIVLYAAGRQLISKKARNGDKWVKVDAIVPYKEAGLREYVWDVSPFIGHTLRLALVDQDPRPGCHLFATAIEFVPHEVFEGREFAKQMLKLSKEHKLPQPARFSSEHFVALSTADDEFTERRLNNCELIYDLFFEHFRKKGFRIYEPQVKLMVAVFDSEAGFNAYLNTKTPFVGVYEPPTNRLVVYDYGLSEDFVSTRRRLQARARRIPSDLHRQRFVATIQRQTQQFRTEMNIGTVMHEVAHQLSFNCGLLNRDGDVAVWLAEGLATYCEPTDNSTWQGIGERNPERLQVLAAQMRSRGGQLIPLRDLVASDAWLRGPQGPRLGLIGYAQSWALFKMLMEERTPQLRQYLATVYTRKTPDHRLTDFLEAFGGNMNGLELRYREYIKEQLERDLPVR